MANIRFEHVTKRFGKVTAVNDFNLVIEDQEFIVIVGPSGCGKSTALRMLAGLDDVSDGEIYIDDVMVNDIPPKDRDIAMVFQNYALYPHMTVENNMSFGMKLRRMPKVERKARVLDAVQILQIEDLLDRRPKELSGGQRQRVALGRAIVRKPKIFLMDEPLSNLDAKLRVEMRASLSQLQQHLKTTTVYVTHDQVEAMTMGSRIVVMKDGSIEQVDSPLNLYNKPVNKFVAGFIGSPAMNFLKGTIEEGSFKNPYANIEIREQLKQNLLPYEHQEVFLGIRPEDLELKGFTDLPENNNAITATVTLVEPIGAETIIIAKVGDEPITARVDALAIPKVNDEITLLVKTKKLHAFDLEDEHNILFDNVN